VGAFGLVPIGLAAFAAALLFGLFAGTQLVLTLRGTQAPCGCNGSSAHAIGWTTTMRAGALLVVSIAVALAPLMVSGRA
jgi:hypothetical protein